MADTNREIDDLIKKLTESVDLNQQALEECQKSISKLGPAQQEKLGSVLDNIGSQLRPINVRQLKKVREVIGNQQQSTPALLSHIRICFHQNQLIAKSINQTQSLITQAYTNSKHDSGNRSRVEHKKQTEALENQTQTNNRTNRPSTGLNRNNPANIPMNTPVRNNWAVLTPFMVLQLRKMRMNNENKVQQRIKGELITDQVVDEKILETDRDADKNILETSQRTNDKLRRAKESIAMSPEQDKVVKGEIVKNTAEFIHAFEAHQKSITSGLSLLLKELTGKAPASEVVAGMPYSTPHP